MIHITVEGAVAHAVLRDFYCNKYPQAVDNSCGDSKLIAASNFQAVNCHLPGDDFFDTDGQSCHIFDVVSACLSTVK